jgi:hypothetical protein
MTSRAHSRACRITVLLMLSCAVVSANGCASIFGIEDLPPLECESSQDCEETRGPGWACDVERHACVPPPAAECSSDAQCTRADEPICDTSVGECKPCNDAGGDAACEARNGGAAPFCVAQGDGVGSCEAPNGKRRTTALMDTDGAPFLRRR